MALNITPVDAPGITLVDANDLALTLTTADIQLSGTAGISMTLVVPVAAGIAWLAAAVAPYRINADGLDLYRSSTLEWDHYRGSTQQSLVFRSSTLAVPRPPQTIALPSPVKLSPSGTTIVAELAGAFDIVPGDIAQLWKTPEMVVISAHIHIGREKPRSWIYG